jgi:hypothetical protein
MVITGYEVLQLVGVQNETHIEPTCSELNRPP